MQFCTHCGTKQDLGALFCSQCGERTPTKSPDKETSLPVEKSSIKAAVVSANWEKKFALIDKAGGPRLPNMRELTFGERLKVSFNVLGFLLGPIYYLAKGMWKKAITLTVIGFALMLLISMFFSEFQFTGLITSIITPVFFATRANIDFYKKIKLRNNGWW